MSVRTVPAQEAFAALWQECRKAGLTTFRKVAALAGCDPTTITQISIGQHPSRGKALAIVQALAKHSVTLRGPAEAWCFACGFVPPSLEDARPDFREAVLLVARGPRGQQKAMAEVIRRADADLAKTASKAES